jgi:hypothetical protein
MAGLAVSLFRARGAEPLGVSFDGDNLRVAAPTLHFLNGKPLARLKDGGTVVYLSQLTLYKDQFVTPLRRGVERFVISYDIWGEDKFSVSMPGQRSVSNLSAKATEAWCLDYMAIGAEGLAPDTPFWLRLDMHTADQKDLSALVGEPGLNLHNLILFFAKRPGADDPSWTLQAGPLRISDLARTPGRGSRGG